MMDLNLTSELVNHLNHLLQLVLDRWDIMQDLPDNKQGIIRVYLKYDDGDSSVIRGLRRVSKPGLRAYANADVIKRSTRNIRGISIVSTSSGVMTNFEAASKRIGGEVLARCW